MRKQPLQNIITKETATVEINIMTIIVIKTITMATTITASTTRSQTQNIKNNATQNTFATYNKPRSAYPTHYVTQIINNNYQIQLLPLQNKKNKNNNGAFNRNIYKLTYL